MALSFIGANPAVATTVTIPAHQVGDIIVICAQAESATLPSKPAAGGTVPTWTDIDANAGANLVSMRTAYCVATATNHTSGSWTSANGLIAAVLRGQNSTPIGGHAESGGATAGSNATAPAVTLTRTDGTSMILHFFGVRQGGTAWSGAPAGYTQQAVTVGDVCLDTKNSTTSDGSVAQSNSAVNMGWRGATVEILAPVTSPIGRLFSVGQAVNRASRY